MRLSTTIVLMLFVVPCASQAEMYKCSENGVTSFQERPCKGAGGAIAVRPASGYGNQQVTPQPAANTSSASSSPQNENERLSQMQRERRLREMSYDIADAEREIKLLETAMETELASLNEKKGRANNNLAGATWEQSISSEMQVVADKYRLKIATAQARLDSLRKERESLKSRS